MTTGNGPEFSVIITVFNKEKYIGKTIESVLNQTYKDFEVIVVDDGSTDKSNDIIKSFHDNRVKYVYQENSGLPACARNKGMNIASGKYIALLDGDDYWYEEKLEKCKAVLDRATEVDLVCHNIAFSYRGKMVKRSSFGPFVEKMYDKLLFEGNCMGPSAVVFRREIVFRDGFRFDESRSLFAIEDYEYWLRLSRKYRFYFMPEVLGCYMATDTGAFSVDNEKNTVNMLALIDSHFARIDCSSGKARMMARKRRSSVMSAAGRMYNYEKRFKESRIWYYGALKEYPYSYKAYIGLLMALVRVRIVYNSV